MKYNDIEYTIRQNFLNQSIVMVRTTTPGSSFGAAYRWGPWKKANYSQRDAALAKLMELNRTN